MSLFTDCLNFQKAVHITSCPPASTKRPANMLPAQIQDPMNPRSPAALSSLLSSPVSLNLRSLPASHSSTASLASPQPSPVKSAPPLCSPVHPTRSVRRRLSLNQSLFASLPSSVCRSPYRPDSWLRSPSLKSFSSRQSEPPNPSCHEHLHAKLDYIIQRLKVIEENQERLSNMISSSPTVSRMQPSIDSTTPMTTETPTGANEMQPGDELFRFCVSSKLKNISVIHFSILLVDRIFTEEERFNRNCRGGGSKNKQVLDPNKLGLVKKLVFDFYNVSPAERNLVWTKCIKAIDEKLRRPLKAC